MFLNVTKMKNLLKTLLLCGVALVMGGAVTEVYGYAKYRALTGNTMASHSEDGRVKLWQVQ